MAYAMAELFGDHACQEAIAEHVSTIIKNNPSERARWVFCIDLSRDFTLNGKIDMDLFSWRRTFLDAVKESEQYPDIPIHPFGLMEWEPPAGKEKLLEMLPPHSYDFYHFSGCKVFKDYLLGDKGHD